MILIPLAALFLLGQDATQDPLGAKLEAAIQAEKSARDAAAIAGYEDILKSYDAERKNAATALFRLAETYRKLGKKTEAQAAYARVVAEFADQTKLAELSRAQLPKATAASDPGQAAARARARELIVEQIRFAELDYEGMMKKYELGAESQQALVGAQRALAKVKLELARFDLRALEAGGER